MISRPDRVQIWSSELAANDFPAVCARTGRPADTWHRFRFITLPGWAYAFLVLVCTGIGLLPVFIIMRLVSRTASGHLPLTRASSQNISLVFRFGLGFVLGMLGLWLVAFFVIAVGGSDNSATNTLGGVLILLGLMSGLAGAVVRLGVRPFVGPRGRVLAAPPGYNQNLVELYRVHPEFVAAVQRRQIERAQAYANYMQHAPRQLPSPQPPLPT